MLCCMTVFLDAAECEKQTKRCNQADNAHRSDQARKYEMVNYMFYDQIEINNANTMRLRANSIISLFDFVLYGVLENNETVFGSEWLCRGDEVNFRSRPKEN